LLLLFVPDVAALKRSRNADDDKEHEELKFEDVISSRVDKVGSVDPVKDFKAIMMRRDDAQIIIKGKQNKHKNKMNESKQCFNIIFLFLF
jgi:hypothetical protein